MEEKDEKSELNKKKVLDKWAPIIDDVNVSDDKKSWLEEYAKMHSINEDSRSIDELTSDSVNLNDESEFTSLLPIATKVAAKTIGQDLASVSPMGGLIPEEEVERIKQRLRRENRQIKIDSLVEEEEFIEKKLEDDEEYKKLVEKYKGPEPELLYIDYKYNNDEEE